jgi:putative hemolysin
MNWLLVVVGAVALLLAAWLRAAASAVSQIPRADAHHDAAEGESGARAVAMLIDDRPRLVPAVGMVGTALLVIAAVALVIPAYERWPLLGAGTVLVGVVALGDVLPRTLGRSRSRPIAYRSAPLLAAAVWVGGSTAERIVEENGNGGEEDEGEHDEDELALISSVLRFSETIVREVMVPRLDMVTLAGEADADEMAALAIEHGFSRFPVMEGDEVIGVLLVKDLLPGLTGGGGRVTARELMRPAIFVPEVKQIPDLLTEMRASKTHMVIVVDEFGEIAGLVTIEDLLEELVGEIADETDDDEIWVVPEGEGVWRVDARLSVEDLAELLAVELPEGDWDTVGGLVLGLAERVPEEAERFDAESCSLEVVRMQGRRVAEVLVFTNLDLARRDAS